MRSGKCLGGSINITHNNTTQTEWLLPSYTVAIYTGAHRDLTEVITGPWFKKYRDVQGIRRKKLSQLLCRFINFFDIHNPFKVAVNQIIYIAAGVLASDDINVDLVDDIGTKIVSCYDDKRLSEIFFKKKNQTKTFGTMEKSVKVGKTVV